MLTYATERDFTDVKKIAEQYLNARGERIISAYLKRATQYIDRVTRRRFFPFYETRLYSVPLDFTDLRTRAYIYGDLSLDADLLEAFSVQTISGDVIASNEVVPAGGITASAISFAAQDAAGLDANGATRFAADDVLLIDNEYLRVLAVVGNEVFVERGSLRTTPAAHAEGVAIQKLVLNTLVAGQNYYPLNWNVLPYQTLRLTWPMSWIGGITGGSIYRWRQPQVLVTGLWGYHDGYPQQAWINSYCTVPVGGLTDSATTFTVADADGTDDIGETRMLENYLLRVDNELMWVTAVDNDTNTVTVLRGRHGTLAQAHAPDTPISRFSVMQDIVEACVVVCNTWRDADASVGGRQGVSEMSEGVQISIPKDQAEVLKAYRRALV